MPQANRGRTPPSPGRSVVPRTVRVTTWITLLTAVLVVLNGIGVLSGGHYGRVVYGMVLFGFGAGLSQQSRALWAGACLAWAAGIVLAIRAGVYLAVIPAAVVLAALLWKRSLFY